MIEWMKNAVKMKENLYCTRNSLFLSSVFYLDLLQNQQCCSVTVPMVKVVVHICIYIYPYTDLELSLVDYVILHILKHYIRWNSLDIIPPWSFSSLLFLHHSCTSDHLYFRIIIFLFILFLSSLFNDVT